MSVKIYGRVQGRTCSALAQEIDSGDKLMLVYLESEQRTEYVQEGGSGGGLHMQNSVESFSDSHELTGVVGERRGRGVQKKQRR